MFPQRGQSNSIASDKICFSANKNCFLFLHENISCEYLLEMPLRGTSNENYNLCFHGETRKKYCGSPILSGAVL